MSNSIKQRTVKKSSVREELEKNNIVFILRRLNEYYRKKMNSIRTKQMRGFEASDFSKNVITKIVSGSRSWENSSRTDFMDFVYDVARSELNGWWENAKKSEFVDLQIAQENKSNLHIRDDYYGY